MSVHFVRARALTLLGGLVLGLFGLFLIPAGAADAHAALIRTNPAQDSVVATAPSEIVITFSEVVKPVVAKIEVIAPGGKRIDTGRPFENGDEMHIPVRTDVPHGTYLVSYRVISADGHPVGGGYTYSVVAPSPGGAPKPINGGATDPVVATAVSTVQFFGFLGLIMVIGPAMVLIALWPRRIDRRNPIRLAYAGLGLVAVTGVLGLYVQAPYDSGSTLFNVSGADVSDVLDSHFGQAVLVRLAIAVVAAFLMRPILAGRGGKADQGLLLVLGLIGVGTWAFAGHAGATDVAPLTIVADVAHLIAVSVWIGGLLMLATFLLRKATARELNAILPVWSNWATLAVTVLVLSGTAQALIEIGTVHALLYTTYGRLVLIKVGLLAVILAFAAGARRIVAQHAGLAAPAASIAVDEGVDEEVEEALVPVSVGGQAGESGDGDGPSAGGGHGREGDYGQEGSYEEGSYDESDYEEGSYDESDYDEGDYDEESDDEAEAVPRGMDAPGVVRRLRRSVLVEFALAVAVLIATSILVQSPPARTAAADAAAVASSNGLMTLNSPIYSLQMDTVQANGVTELHLFAYDLKGAPLKVDQWEVTATLPAQNLGPIPAAITPITDSHAVGQISLTVPGQWTFAFTLRISALDEATVTTVVPIS